MRQSGVKIRKILVIIFVKVLRETCGYNEDQPRNQYNFVFKQNYREILNVTLNKAMISFR